MQKTVHIHFTALTNTWVSEALALQVWWVLNQDWNYNNVTTCGCRLALKMKSLQHFGLLNIGLIGLPNPIFKKWVRYPDWWLTLINCSCKWELARLRQHWLVGAQPPSADSSDSSQTTVRRVNSLSLPTIRAHRNKSSSFASTTVTLRNIFFSFSNFHNKKIVKSCHQY